MRFILQYIVYICTLFNRYAQGVKLCPIHQNEHQTQGGLHACSPTWLAVMQCQFHGRGTGTTTQTGCISCHRRVPSRPAIATHTDCAAPSCSGGISLRAVNADVQMDSVISYSQVDTFMQMFR